MIVSVNHLTKHYGTFEAVSDISFELRKGEVVGFLGVNGAGKSTTMKMLMGGILPTSGDILIDGVPLSENLIFHQRKMGYLPENNPLYVEMFVVEYLHFIAQIYQASPHDVQKAIHQTGLSEYASRRIRELSKGYKQRVGLASAILHNPQILILDEPTTGLDPNQIVEFRNIIKELGKDRIVLLSSHILQEIESVCQRVIILHKGKIALDAPLESLKEGEQTIEVEFDYRIEKEFFKSIPQLSEVINNYAAFYTLSFSTKEDARGNIFDFATQNGLKILQINHKYHNLQQIFTQITSQ